ncbi:MAG: N-(5'-phosphoribosyl)anthranilate isomerase, partial [Limnohabitans sp.]|nr:N-(5'-phosphoribosyl)anthranilate isomerase [Limnohabitans sp.]
MTLPAHFTPIKICGLTREQDVDAAVQAGVQAIGFVLYERSPRRVSAQRAAALARRLPAFVNPVLLVVNASEATIEAACNEVPGAWLQFHGDENPAFCQRVAERLGRRWLRAARIPLDESAPAFD